MASQALAPIKGSTAVARQDGPYAQLRNQLETRIDDFKMALPSHITPEKFQRTVLTAAQSNPDILKADRASLITACMKAAQDGLLPDGREAALVKFNTKINGEWVDAVQYMPMVFGLRKKILQSGEISTIETNVVYVAEVESGAFIYEAGTEAMLRHRPMLTLTDEQSGDDQIVAAYSVAVMKDGTRSFEVMRRSEINKVRQASQTGKLGGKYPPKGPWVDWFGEMARKTVMRRHSKTLPMSGDLVDVEASDEALAARSATTLLGAVEPDAPRLVPPTRADVAADAHDSETGEVIEEEDSEAIARRLDAETLREVEGLSDDNLTDAEGPADADRSEAHTETDPRVEMVTRIASDLSIARCTADIKAADNLFVQHRAAMSEEQVAQIEAAAAAAKVRIAGGQG